MREKAKGPSDLGSRRSGSQAGDRVRQLLNLASALTRAASSAAAVPQAGTGASDAGVAGAAGFSTIAEGSFPAGTPSVGATPLGMDVAVLNDSESLKWAQDVEMLACIVQALQMQAAGDIARRKDAGGYEAIGARTPVELLVQSLRLGAGEASRRIRLAKSTLPAPDALTGEIYPAAHPLLGAAFTAGAISQDSAMIIKGFLDDAARLVKDELIDDDTYADIEDLLVGAGRNEAPDHLRRIGARVMAHIDPDGQKPSKGDLIAKQGLFFRQARRGLIHFDGHMTIPQYEQLMVAIGIGVNPNRHTDIDTINQPADAGSTNQDEDHAENGNTAGADQRRNGDTSADAGDAGVAGGPAGTAGNNDSGGSKDGQESFLDHLGEMFNMFNAERRAGATSGQPDCTSTAQPRPGEEQTRDPHPDCGTNPTTNPDTKVSAASAPNPRQDSEAEPEAEPFSAAEPDPPDAAAAPGPDSAPRSEPNSGNEADRDDFWPSAETANEKPAYRLPAMHNGALTSWGWARLLEDWEIPPRPAGAPSNAIPPRFEGESWFWLPPDPASSNSQDQEREPDQSPESGPRAGQKWESDQNQEFGQTSPESQEYGQTSPEDQDRPDGPDGPDSADNWGIPLNEPGLFGSEEHPDDQRWIVDGISIPHPGSGETLSELETRDPASTDRVTLDERTYGQKLLDGLLDCVKLAARTGTLPINGGLKTQLIITTTQADLDRTDRAGTIFTSRSGPVPLSLFGQELCDAEITPLFCGEGQKILDVGRTRRLFTPPQRKILYARDLGCTFPDCKAHASMTEAHHIIPWHEGGPTSIENGALLCQYHHSMMHNSDWTMTLINGTPYFTAPYMVDPAQTPRHNNYHHGLTQNTARNNLRYKA